MRKEKGTISFVLVSFALHSLVDYLTRSIHATRL